MRPLPLLKQLAEVVVIANAISVLLSRSEAPKVVALVVFSVYTRVERSILRNITRTKVDTAGHLGRLAIVVDSVPLSALVLGVAVAVGARCRTVDNLRVHDA